MVTCGLCGERDIKALAKGPSMVLATPPNILILSILALRVTDEHTGTRGNLTYFGWIAFIAAVYAALPNVHPSHEMLCAGRTKQQ